MAKNKHAAALGRRNKGKPKTRTEAANEARRRNWAAGRDRLRVLREARKKLANATGERTLPAGEKL